MGKGLRDFGQILIFVQIDFEAYEKVLSGHDGTSESGALVSGRERFPGRDEFRTQKSSHYSLHKNVTFLLLLKAKRCYLLS